MHQGVYQYHTILPSGTFPLLNSEQFPSLSHILLITFLIPDSIPFYKVSKLIYPIFSFWRLKLYSVFTTMNYVKINFPKCKSFCLIISLG